MTRAKIMFRREDSEQYWRITPKNIDDGLDIIENLFDATDVEHLEVNIRRTDNEKK